MMWRALRPKSPSVSSSSPLNPFPWFNNRSLSSSASSSSLITNSYDITATTKSSENNNSRLGLLNIEEVQKILNDVKADNVKIVPVKDQCDWTDFMVFVTGRSAWHVRNIGQALIYQVKQKQRGAQRMLLPSVEGEKEGKWIVIDSGTIVIHALDEKARDYYNLERLWASETSSKEQSQDLEKAFLKVRRKNNSKRPAQTSA